MQLFSKRNETKVEDKSFLKDSLRNRIIQEIEYLTSTDEFLEKCFLLNDERNDKWFLENDSIQRLFSRELGYDITFWFNFRPFSLRTYDNLPNDYALFDLIEMLLIFSKEDFRKSVRERFQKHFLEEGDEYTVHDFLIAHKNRTDIKPYISFLKDKILRDRLEQYYAGTLENNKNYELLARISADVIQFLFSGESKDETKRYSEKLVKELAEKSVDKIHIKQFSEILNSLVLNAKLLNNQISNIRHTDRSTLLVDNPSIFKLIAAENIYITEYVIFANPERYFFSQKAIDFKNEYIEKYKIPVAGWIIKNPKKKKEEEIDDDDIPF